MDDQAAENAIQVEELNIAIKGLKIRDCSSAALIDALGTAIVQPIADCIMQAMKLEAVK